MAELGKFKAAIRASGLTLQEAADLAKVSRPTLVSRQDDPMQFRLYELKGIYDGMDATGRGLLTDAVSEIFLSD